MVSLLDRVTTTDQVDELSPLDPFVYQASVGVSLLLSLWGAGATTGIGVGIWKICLLYLPSSGEASGLHSPRTGEGRREEPSVAWVLLRVSQWPHPLGYCLQQFVLS